MGVGATRLTYYRLLLVLKLAGVLVYSGGLTASLLATSPEQRRRAVHAVASPALVVIWLAGYLLANHAGVALTELWVLGGLVLSLASQLALVYRAARAEAGAYSAVGSVAPVALALVLMVFRPTWSTVLR